VRGASAIDAIAKEVPGVPLRVFVIWEPVVWSDALRPSDRSMARKLPDERALHYWDPSKSLSAEILRAPWTRKFAVRGGPLGVVWDWVALYPAGARWQDAFPEPVVQGFPVVDAEDRARAWVLREASASNSR
jgi:hypothetical protein